MDKVNTTPIIQPPQKQAAPQADPMLRCSCGARRTREQFVKIPARGIWRHVCVCGMENGYPIGHPWFETLCNVSPTFQQQATQEYSCKACRTPIDKERALSTFGLFGRALCSKCQGQEE